MKIRSTLERRLDSFPRAHLTRTPTPLDSLDRLGRSLGARLFMKRDDLTDLALGGDKPRKLEYELALAIENGCDTIVTTGSAQSNHARLTTAACRKLGLHPVVVLGDDERRAIQGNLLTVLLMEAEVHFIDEDRAQDHWGLEPYAHEIMTELSNQGRRPHYVPVSGTTPRSCLGYVRAGLELADQLEEKKVRPAALYVPFGTGGIFTSMLLAFRAAELACPVIGVSVNQPRQACQERFDEWLEKVGELLSFTPSPGTYEITDDFIGSAYGAVTDSCLEAISITARTEGILLDPVYSGKVMSGLMEHCHRRRWTDSDTVVFLHSGGVPALFAYSDQLDVS